MIIDHSFDVLNQSIIFVIFYSFMFEHGISCSRDNFEAASQLAEFLGRITFDSLLL